MTFCRAFLAAKIVPAANAIRENFLHVQRIFQKVHFTCSPEDGGSIFARDVELMGVEVFEVRSLDATFTLDVFIPASRFETVLVHQLLVQDAKLLDALLRLAAGGNLAVDQNLLVQTPLQ
jgi:hypothetical protein